VQTLTFRLTNLPNLNLLNHALDFYRWMILLYASHQNRRQKFFSRGLQVCAGGFAILKFDKTSTDYNISYFNLRGLGPLSGWAEPTKAPPVATRLLRDVGHPSLLKLSVVQLTPLRFMKVSVTRNLMKLHRILKQRKFRVQSQAYVRVLILYSKRSYSQILYTLSAQMFIFASVVYTYLLVCLRCLVK